MNKETILREIKRTAEQNGGVPLGKERFASETGIQPWEVTRFWVRWGDAVREAGYSPNQLQRTLDTFDILAKLVSFIRELGYFPVNAELRMKARQSPDFPSHSVWTSKFGNKQQLAAAVLKYAAGQVGYEDVAVICGPIAGDCTSGKESDEDEAEQDPADEFGFVYLLKAGRYYKVGRSNAFGRREREIALQLPEKATTVHTIRTDDPAGIEAYWHRRFEERRRNGEWFELSSEDVRAFKRRKFM
jgi:hypothetical protein